MNILEIDEIFLTILKDLDIDSIWSLLLINICINNKITEYYKNNDIVFNDMPLFRPCSQISKYLTHYKSYYSGRNFPEKPLWLFNNKNDCQYVEIDNKYIKLENVRFERPKFFSYFTSYEFQKFGKAFIHWKRLNNQQKYLIWCAIKNYHPEIKLDKTLISEDMATLLSELYWHYDDNFVRHYLQIYFIDTCDLINSKFIARTEIEMELEHYRGHHFLQGYNIVYDKKMYASNYFNLCGVKRNQIQRHREIYFRVALQNVIRYLDISDIKSFKSLNVTSDILEKKISFLNNILDEIHEFDITQTHGLKTMNINYLDHMSINYPTGSGDLTGEISKCIQQ